MGIRKAQAVAALYRDTTASADEQLRQVLRESGEFTQDGAGKGESSRAHLTPVIDEALWLLTKG